jgi:hypothetical protein
MSAVHPAAARRQGVTIYVDDGGGLILCRKPRFA